MRAAKTTPLHNKNKEICAVILQGACCAEHEWGITPLQEMCGVKPLTFQAPTNPKGYPKDYKGPWGLERITIRAPKWTIPSTSHPQATLILIKEEETKTHTGKCLLWAEATRQTDPRELAPLGTNNTETNPYRGDPIEFSKGKIARDTTAANTAKEKGKRTWRRYETETSGAWTDDGLAILTRNPEVAAFLEIIHEGLQGKNPKAAIWTGGAGDNPFARNGLILGIPERIDPENKQAMEQAEQEAAKTHWLAQETGIYETIPKHLYYGLKPGKPPKTRKTPGGQPEPVPPTKHPVMFFLNPTDQRKNKFGWFTVEELTAWAKGEPNPIENPTK
jgi:hypothetical protein